MHAGLPESAAGWAYRESEAAAVEISDTAVFQPLAQALSLPIPTVERKVDSTEDSQGGGLLAAATQILFLSCMSAGLAALAVVRLFSIVPVAASRMILPDRRV